jgi:putative FmdB family regulatory protein
MPNVWSLHIASGSHDHSYSLLMCSGKAKTGQVTVEFDRSEAGSSASAWRARSLTGIDPGHICQPEASMPTYEYACAACGNAWEEIQKITAPPVELCPACGKSTAKRQISGGNFILKGGGWYSDLYSSAKPAAKEDSTAKSGDAGSSSKSEGTSDAKSDGASKSSEPKKDSGSSSGSASSSGSSGSTGSGGSSKAAE